MGIGHILYIYEDGIMGALSILGEPSDKYEPIRNAPGDAILKLCLSPDWMIDDDGHEKKVNWAPLLTHENCVNHVDDIHSKNQALYLWIGNCCRIISDLNDAEIEAAQRLLSDELKKREDIK